MAAPPGDLLLAVGLLVLVHQVHGRSGKFINKDDTFDQNYVITWGRNHVLSLDGGREI